MKIPNLKLPTSKLGWLKFGALSRSIWLFPVVLAIVVILMTSFKLNGSSIGIYHQYFYGKSKDPALILNKPREIRSDEWLTNTQMDLAQKNSGYPKINPNVGNGEDTSLILAVPSKDWSSMFKLQNLAYFVLPFDYAFAFKWWLMGYLLVMSVYFFVLLLMPKRRLLAATISLGVFFSPFIQWWYQYITLAPIYYGLFATLIFVHLLRAKSRLKIIFLGLALAYLATCFVLVLYPPFQVACALAILAFLIGYLVEHRKILKARETLFKATIVLCAGIITAALTFGFIRSNRVAYDATKNTAYPGHRNIVSGGFDGSRLLTSNLAFQFQFTRKATNYYFPSRGIANQSEASNFIYLMPFLVIAEVFLITHNYRKRKKMDWALLATLILFSLLMIRLLTPYLNGFFKLLLLNQVLANRLLIGLGLLGVINIVLFIRNLSGKYSFTFSTAESAIYCLAVFIVELAAGKNIQQLSPGFVSNSILIVLCLPIPIIIYLLLKKHFVASMLVLLAFSVFSTIGVNPVYRGTDVLTNSKLSAAVKNISHANSGKWVTEGIMLENIAIANGAPSLSGVYIYPQLGLWKPLDPGGNQIDIYNRYAHVDFKIDRSIKPAGTSIKLRGGDNILVTTSPCNDYLRQEKVSFLLTDKPLNPQQGCVQLIDQVVYPANSFYIYKIN